GRAARVLRRGGWDGPRLGPENDGAAAELGEAGRAGPGAGPVARRYAGPRGLRESAATVERRGRPGAGHPAGRGGVARGQGVVDGVAFTPDGRRALSIGFDDHFLRVWDLGKGEEVIAFRVNSVPRGVAVSPDGRLAACGSRR